MNEKNRKKFTKGFTATISGVFEVEAETREEADKMFDNGDYEQFDNKSDYHIDDEWLEE